LKFIYLNNPSGSSSVFFFEVLVVKPANRSAGSSFFLAGMLEVDMPAKRSIGSSFFLAGVLEGEKKSGALALSSRFGAVSGGPASFLGATVLAVGVADFMLENKSIVGSSFLFTVIPANKSEFEFPDVLKPEKISNELSAVGFFVVDAEAKRSIG
jgi:hypothetical protein